MDNLNSTKKDFLEALEQQRKDIDKQIEDLKLKIEEEEKKAEEKKITIEKTGSETTRHGYMFGIRKASRDGYDREMFFLTEQDMADLLVEILNNIELFDYQVATELDEDKEINMSELFDKLFN